MRHLHAKLYRCFARSNRGPCTTAHTQTGLRTVLVEADASAIDRHAKRGIQPTAQLHQQVALLSNAPTLAVHVQLEHLLKRSNRGPCTTARAQTGLRTVLVETDASAIDRHAKRGMQPTAQLHQQAALLSNAPTLAVPVEQEHLLKAVKPRAVYRSTRPDGPEDRAGGGRCLDY